MTNMPANSALTGSSVTEGGFKTALDQALDAIRERVEDGTTGMVTANLEPGTDAASDLGTASKRYRDAYFSGGIYLGGTAAVNLLNFSERGTFTPALAFGGASVGMAYSTQTGAYRKIGRTVFISMTIQLSNKGSSTGSATITGLPFTSSSSQGGAAVLTISVGNVVLNSGGGFYSPIARVGSNSTSINLFEEGNGVSVTALTDANFANNSILRIDGSYFTDS